MVAMIAEWDHMCGLTPQELTEFRTRMGWLQPSSAAGLS
jgi:hypothetical protein